MGKNIVGQGRVDSAEYECFRHTYAAVTLKL